MQKTIVLLSVIFFSLNLKAQEVQHVKKDRLANFYVAPAIGIELLNITKYEKQKNGYPVSYKGKPSLRFGLDLMYKKSEKFQFLGGAFFARKTYNRTEEFQENAIDVFYASKYKYNYVEAYVGGNYNFLIGRLDIGFYTNLNFAFLVSATETRETLSNNSFEFNKKDESTKGLTIIEPGLQFNYNLTYRLSFALKTGYRFYANAMVNDKSFKTNAAMFQPGLFYMF